MRYPEPGKAKTRLIPALGAAGAADLYREMAEYTLAQVQALQKQKAIEVEIRFAGGTQNCMEGWLGKHWKYVSQGEGDLGDRMGRSFQDAFQDGMQRTVIIGTDCPEVDSAVLDSAFQALHHYDLVIGPATDGGYYLIGQRHPMPEIFSQIPWSTSEVFEKTMTIVETLGITISCLPMLSDVDYPSDLAIWEKAKQTSTTRFL